MNYLRVCLLLFVLVSIGLNAGTPPIIEKGNNVEKELKLTLEHDDSQEDQDKVRITVLFKGDEFTVVHLINHGTNSVVPTKLKENGMVSLSFEIEKTNIESGYLHITNLAVGANCGDQYLLYLKAYVR